MAAAVIQEPEVAPEVQALTDETRRELVALREGGMTLAELKARFPQLTGEQIREVLPPGNARERKQREVKQPKAKPQPKKDEAPKPEPKPRYAEGEQVVSLAERALACRQVMGRNALAEALDTTGSAVWRFENGRIHPDEATSLETGLAAVEKRIAAGEFVKAEKQPAAKSPSKAALEARIDAAIQGLREAAADKRVTKAAAIATALERLDPPQPTE